MSGGKFDYQEYNLLEWANKIQLEIAKSGKQIPKKRYGGSYEPTHYWKYEPDTIKVFEEAVALLHKTYAYIKAIDYFLCDDTGEDGLREDIKYRYVHPTKIDDDEQLFED